MTIVYDSSKRRITLSKEVGHGGEAVIRRVQGQAGLLAKIYVPPIHPHYEPKVAWMKDHPPEEPDYSAAVDEHKALAWPIELLYDRKNKFTGYLMPRIRWGVTLLKAFNPRLRAQALPFDRKYLHRVGRNLAAAVASLHAKGYVVGDLHESNVIVTSQALVTMIDTDSFQVQAAVNEEAVCYRCVVGKPEYTAPELQGKHLADVTRKPEQDNFALAVLIFQLLMGGNHPFRSQWGRAGDPPPLEVKIARGLFPHVKPPPDPVTVPPNVPSLDTLHPVLSSLMQRCFVDGHKDPYLRPTAAEWRGGLEEAEAALVQCTKGHYYSGHLGRKCPRCRIRRAAFRRRQLAFLPQVLAEIRTQGAQLRQALTQKQIGRTLAQLPRNITRWVQQRHWQATRPARPKPRRGSATRRQVLHQRLAVLGVFLLVVICLVYSFVSVTSSTRPRSAVVQATRTSLPTWSPKPTFTEMPTITPIPTLIPIPTSTPIPTFTSTPWPAIVLPAPGTPVDIVLVLDTSSSMEHDTLCYGCWDPWGTNVPGTSEGDCYDPDGCLYPLKWSQDSPTAIPNHCRTGNTYSDTAGYTHTDEYYRSNSGDQNYYIVIEAEEYSSYDLRADYRMWHYTPFRTFWVIQRNAFNFYHGNYVDARGRDSRGGYISHHPWSNKDSTSGYGVSCLWGDVTSPGHDGDGPYCNSSDPDIIGFGGPFPVPRVDYAFTAPSSGNYYFWIRAQGGYNDADNNIFWGVASGTTPLRYPTGQEGSFSAGANYDGARRSHWDWERLTSGGQDGVNLTGGQMYVLSFWGGGAGFDIDRIIITNDSTDYGENDDETDDGDYLPLKNAPANNARTGWACKPCDPRFAGLPGGLLQSDGWWLPDCSIGDQSDDPIYDGEAPIQPTIGAAARFVSQIDYSRDQVGYVRYDSNSAIRNSLECLYRRGPADLTNPACDLYWFNPGQEPPTDPDCGCFDEDFNSTIDNSIIYQLNSTFSEGSTNMAGGMRDGITVLSNASGQYGRPEAAHVMVLMTDGMANQIPDSYCDDDPDRQWPEGSAAQDCVIYYAYEARKNNIVIHTISLGYSADIEIMQEVADITGGEHRWIPTPNKLDSILDDIFLHITGLGGE